ncbi:MAG: PepSY-like domain-containing protein [Muribaculaceae bacterium]
MKSISKFTLLTLLLAFAAMTSCSEQEQLDESSIISSETSNLPALIAEDFGSNYPDATAVDWEVDADYASATFTVSNNTGEGTPMGVWYNMHNQKRIMSSSTVDYDNIPDAVKLAFQNSDYGTWEHYETVTLLNRYNNDAVSQIYIVKAKGSFTDNPTLFEASLSFTAEGVLIQLSVDEIRSNDDERNNRHHSYDEWLYNAIPDYVTTFVNNNYPGAHYLHISKTDDAATVKILNGHTVATLQFDAAGNWLSTRTRINAKDLPAEVRSAIKYDGFNYSKICQIEECVTADSETYYIITVKDKKGNKSEIRINEDGTIVDGGNIESGNDSNGTNNADNLCKTQAEVEAFIQNRYPGATIQDWDDDDKELEVELLYNGTKIDVLFNHTANGYEWSSSEWDLDYRQSSTIPAAIQNVITTKYSGYQLYYISYIETANNGNYYEVGLKTSRQNLKVKFDEQGNVLAEY